MSVFVFATLVLSGIPKPDLVSVDFGSVQAGGGYIITSSYPGNFFSLELSLSAGQARFYWGNKWAFWTGLELFRCQIVGSEITPYGFGPLFMPQAGLSRFLGPIHPRTITLEACGDPPLYWLLYGEDYVPRFDIACGFSPLSVVGSSIIVLPTLRIEAKLLITRSLQLILANQNIWFYDEFDKQWHGEFNTTSLSLCMAVGRDFINKEVDE